MKNQQFSSQPPPLSPYQPHLAPPPPPAAEPQPDSPEPVRPVGCDSEDSEEEVEEGYRPPTTTATTAKWRPPKKSSQSSSNSQQHRVNSRGVGAEIAPPTSMDYYAHASSGKGKTAPAKTTDLSQSFLMGMANRNQQNRHTTK